LTTDLQKIKNFLQTLRNFRPYVVGPTPPSKKNSVSRLWTMWTVSLVSVSFVSVSLVCVGHVDIVDHVFLLVLCFVHGE
jgi:hypothetical protein